jgi:hypothetical protein
MDEAKRYQVRAVELAIEVVEEMKESARYVKIVEWSEDDQCYVGSSPGLICGSCHGEQ